MLISENKLSVAHKLKLVKKKKETLMFLVFYEGRLVSLFFVCANQRTLEKGPPPALRVQ